MAKIACSAGQAAILLGMSSWKVRDLCASGHLECRKDPWSTTWTVLVSLDRIQPSEYIAVGDFDGSVGLDFALIDKIEEYGDEMFDANSDYGSPPNSEEDLARIKGEICTIIRALQK